MSKNIVWLKSGLFWSMAIAFCSSYGLPTQAVETADGTSFESGLLLQDTYTTFNGIRVRQAKYYFDLELPQDAGENLAKVVIQQRTGGDEVKFKPDRTTAYLGNHRQKQEALPLTASVDEATGAITIKFDRSIPPGNTITIGLKPSSNPDYGGVYLFGVTAYPTGEKPRGMYLGPGRLHFYQNDSWRF